MTETTTTPSTDVRQEYLQQLQAQLADLDAKIRYTGRELEVQGLTIYVELGGPYPNQIIREVSFRTGYGRRGGRHTYRRDLSVERIAKQIRRVAAKQAADAKARDAYWKAATAKEGREELAKQRVAAAAEAINASSCAASYGRVVRKIEVDEVTVNRQPTYRFDLALTGLTEGQSLSVLAIVALGKTWEATAPSCDNSLVNDHNSGQVYVCTLPAGHDGAHSDGHRRWS